MINAQSGHVIGPARKLILEPRPGKPVRLADHRGGVTRLYEVREEEVSRGLTKRSLAFPQHPVL
jgi:hypothetical protein